MTKTAPATTPATAKKTVVFAVVASGAVTVIGKFGQGERPLVRSVIGSFLAAGLLSMVADPAPKIAVGLAYTLLVSTALTAGVGPFQQVAKLVTGGRK